MLLAACSAAERPASTTQARTAEAADGVKAEELVAQIVSATNSGELCPTVPWDADHNGLPDNILITTTNDVISLGFGPVLYECGTPEAASYSKDLSANPSCTVTLDVEVPAGVRMGVPNAAWHGYARDESGPVTATRSYAFENGASISTPTSVLGEDFVLSDRSLSAYSPTCSGAQRVRLTATFQAALGSSSTVLQLDSLDFVTSWRRGTEFKEGCSSDELLSAAPAAAGEWCGGYHDRACADGLRCDFNERDSVNGNSSGAEGTCVDPNQPGGVAELGAECDGLTNIQCPAGAVCWHKPQAPANWMGQCIREAADKGKPCHIGSPALECGAPFVCLESSHTCVESHGESGDPCGQSNLPDCVYPGYCQQDAEECVAPRGAGGDPCGAPELPDCRSPGYCENERCVDPRGKLGAACGEGTLGCGPRLTCINRICAPTPSATCVTPKG
jgi:hypothetical protein